MLKWPDDWRANFNNSNTGAFEDTSNSRDRAIATCSGNQAWSPTCIFTSHEGVTYRFVNADADLHGDSETYITKSATDGDPCHSTRAGGPRRYGGAYLPGVGSN